MKPIPFAGTMLREDRHVCAFFSSAAEEYDTLLPFVCDGINCGHRAYHVLPHHHQDDHFQQLRGAGIDVDKVMQSRQLEVAVPEDTYLRSGRFDKDAMLVLIQDALKAGAELGFPLTRMIAHAEAAVDDWKSGNEWVEYEMRLNSVLPNLRRPGDLHVRRQPAERAARHRHSPHASDGHHRRRPRREQLLHAPA